jgi:hypothetical protein
MRDLTDEEFDEFYDAKERWENKNYPNVPRVRAKIQKLRESKREEDWTAAFNATMRLDKLLEMELHEHIKWPLPSWRRIRSRREYGG